MLNASRQRNNLLVKDFLEEDQVEVEEGQARFLPQACRWFFPRLHFSKQTLLKRIQMS